MRSKRRRERKSEKQKSLPQSASLTAPSSEGAKMANPIYLCGFSQNKTASFETVFGALEGIRIPDLPLRRRTLYPAELQAHIIVPYNTKPYT